MVTKEVEPFLGRECSVVVNCRACGNTHARTGLLTRGGHDGEVMLSGVVYSIDDLLSISADAARSTFILPIARALPYLGLAAGVLSWIRIAHR